MTRMVSEFSLKFLLMNIEYFLGFGIKLETLALLQPL